MFFNVFLTSQNNDVTRRFTCLLKEIQEVQKTFIFCNIYTPVFLTSQIDDVTAMGMWRHMFTWSL